MVVPTDPALPTSTENLGDARVFPHFEQDVVILRGGAVSFRRFDPDNAWTEVHVTMLPHAEGVSNVVVTDNAVYYSVGRIAYGVVLPQ